MTDVNKLITDNMDVWTSAIKKRNTQGRGSIKKIQLTGVKKLRELILELAMRGKLVPQDVNDEPASVLLERIVKEKAKLIKEKKIKKQKLLPKITKEETPFELPNGWGVSRLGGIGVITSSSRVNKKDWQDKGVPFYRAREIVQLAKTGSAIDDLFISDSLFKKLSDEGISPDTNDIMITGVGTIGVPYIVKHDDKFYFKDASVLIFKNYFNFDADYLKLFCTSPYWNKTIHSKSMGTTVHTLTIVRANESILIVPPLAEQHRIVAKVDELMALCDQLEQQTEQSLTAHQTLVEVLLNALFLSPVEGNAEANAENNTAADIANKTELNVKEQAKTSVKEQFQENWQRIADHFDVLFTTEASIDQLKQTILQLAVMGKLVPQNPSDEPASVLLEKIAVEKAQLIADKKIKKPKSLPKITDEEKPFELPSGWAFERLEKMTSLITKGSSPKWQGVSYTEDPTDVLFVTSENVGAFELRLDKKKYVEKKFNDVEPRSILQKHDFLMNIVGASIGRTATYNIDTLANINQAVCLIRSFPQLSCNKYFLTFFNSNICISYMYDKQVDNARPNLSMANISKFVIPLPPFEEQQRIVAKVEELMALCDQLKTRLADAQITQLHLADAVVENALN